MKPERCRILLIIGSTMVECYHTARAFDLDMVRVGNMRCVTKPQALRGWSRGTPFIALNRNAWPGELDQTLDALTREGRLRIANNEDLRAFAETEHA